MSEEEQHVPIAVQLRGLRKVTITDVLGEFGERAAVEWLTSQGCRTCRADTIDYLGHSLAIRDSLKECDCQRLPLLAGMCAQVLKCCVPGMPCKNAPSEFFAFHPDHRRLGPGFVAVAGDNGFRFPCSKQMSHLAVLGRCDTRCDISPCFIKSYLQIHAYIHNLYSLHATEPERRREYNLDPSDPDFLPARDSTEWQSFWNGHPGRLDLFGVMDAKPVCLKVKANRGRLSKWQYIRMRWMINNGFNAYVVRVRLDATSKNEILDLFNNSKIDEAFRMVKPECQLEDIEASSKEEFMQLVPTPQQIQEYNEKCKCWSLVSWL